MQFSRYRPLNFGRSIDTFYIILKVSIIFTLNSKNNLDRLYFFVYGLNFGILLEIFHSYLIEKFSHE